MTMTVVADTVCINVRVLKGDSNGILSTLQSSCDPVAVNNGVIKTGKKLLSLRR